MIWNCEQQFVGLLKCVGLCNVFNLSAILSRSSGYPHTEDLTVLSFFPRCSFTKGNTDECHPKSYYTASVLGSPFPECRQSASSILAGCWSELTLGSSCSEWTDTDPYGGQAAQPTYMGLDLILCTPRAPLHWRSCSWKIMTALSCSNS